MSRRVEPTGRPGRVLFTDVQIRARIGELGARIARDYKGKNPVLVGVLQGAFMFMADLIRAIPIDLTTDFIGLSSYGASAGSSGVVRLVADMSVDVTGRHVLIVEDIIDTGRTLSYLKRTLEARRPQSVRVCVLLDKAERRVVPVPLDYRGFTVENLWVVGYGFDLGGVYRNLPHITALESA